MVKRDDVLKIAKLAMLYIEEEEIESWIFDMNKLIGFADTIKSVEDDELEDFDDISNIVNAFHEDEVVKSLDRELVLKSRDGGEDGYFIIKRERNNRGYL